MANDKKSFSDSRVYPIIFMVIVTIIFGSMLAVFYHSTSERIAGHSEARFKKTLLSLYGIFPENDQIESFYDQYVTELTTEEFSYYRVTIDQQVQGYTFVVSGSGLWGTITALVAIKADFDSLIDLQILDQNETPGLGGRITESSFLEQFRGKNIKQNGKLVRYLLVPENETASEVQIQQITGATSSSNAVVDILYRNLQEILRVIGD